MGVRYVALGKEVTFKEAVEASVYLNARCSDNPDNAIVTPKPVASIHERDYIIGPYTNQGRIDGLYVNPDNIGDLLMALFGNDSVLQLGTTSAYLHDFTFNDTPPSYTLRKGVEIGEEILAGTLFGKLTTNFTSKDGVKASADFYNTKLKTSGAVGTPVLSNLNAFPCMNLSANSGNLNISSVDKRALIYDCEITIARSIPYNKVFNLEEREMPSKKAGGVSVSGKLSAIFNNASERDRVLSCEPFTLTVNVAGPQIEGAYYYSFGFELHRCVYLNGGSPAVVEQDEPLVADMPFRAHYDTTAGFNSAAHAYLQNTRSTAY